jgi:hypothetical protein
MKISYCLPLVALLIGSSALAAGDPCRAKALSAAEDAYGTISGNGPSGTTIAVLIKGKKYAVTVGIGDPEDGSKDYIVTFPSGCDSEPKVVEAN